MTKFKTLIIAEAGVNHNGNLSLAKELIEVAANSGADYIKFQTFKAHKVVRINTPKVRYQFTSAVDTESQFEMLRRLELKDSDHLELINYARNFGIGFISTAFDIESANMLLSFGQEIFKIQISLFCEI